MSIPWLAFVCVWIKHYFSIGLAPMLRKIVHWAKFAWEFLESLMISATQLLNRLSKDYRYVACCLSEEKKRLKVWLACQFFSQQIYLGFLSFKERIVDDARDSREQYCLKASFSIWEGFIVLPCPSGDGGLQGHARSDTTPSTSWNRLVRPAPQPEWVRKTWNTII